ncbi:hypothetical protein Voc01_066050 [Virgisporangium ochraceum]|uniref:Peptidase M48 domain-containing protein n=2 Tax=Virgisporangium ochraceum TaxID=65505 RepID=A0A8J3ZYP5_9ACTN|nr:hypothetical protein Voc01_066050 [Virgisporangium ochraceum]
MTYAGQASVAAPGPDPRPRVLAFPAPSLARFGMLAVVLVITGAFAGIWLHLELRRDAYLARAEACEQEASRTPLTLPEPRATARRIQVADRCRAPAERERAGYMLGGALTAMLAGSAVVFLTPLVVRRRWRLRPLTVASVAVERRAAELAAGMGLRRTVRLRLGRSDLADPFAYGRPGVHRVALTRGLLAAYRSDPAVFDAVMRHELAHLRHGDVAWTAVASSVWYVVGPMLAVPVVVAVTGTGLSLLPGYLWRVTVLAVVVHLVTVATLRTREHDADLRAAEGRWEGALRSALSHARDAGGRPWYRRGPLALHPSPARRLAVLDRPQTVASLSFVDALVAGFLATTTVALVVEIGWTATVGTAAQAGARLAGALAAGALLGPVIGLALIRQVLVCRVVGQSPVLAPAAVGVGLGVAVGQIVAVAGTGTGRLAGLEQPVWLLVSASFAIGATMVCGSAAALLAGYAGRTRHARAVWIPAVLVTTAVYTVALWIAGQAQLLADGAGMSWLLAWSVTGLAAPAVLLAGASATAAAVTALTGRGSDVLPAWLSVGPPAPDRTPASPGGLTALVVGLSAGSGGAVVLAANRALRGAATTEAAQVQRFYTAVWIAAVAAAAATMALSVRSASRGPALAAVAGPVAVGTVVCGLVTLNLVQGTMPSWDAIWTVSRLSVALGVALGLLVAAAALFGHEGGPRPVVVAGATTVLTLVVAALIAAFPGAIVPTILLTA